MSADAIVDPKLEEEKDPENGDIFDGGGNCIGGIDPFKDMGEAIDAELSVFHDGFLYVYKFDYRTKAS